MCSGRLHYKERLVELLNRCHADPAVLFSPAEMIAELQRWHVAVPTRKPDEPEPLYTHRLRLVSNTSISPLKTSLNNPLITISVSQRSFICPLMKLIPP